MLTITIPQDESPRSTFHTFHCTEKQAQAIAQLRTAHKGLGAVKGYKPSTNWTVVPTQNVQMVAGFILSRLYKKQIAAMRELKLEDLDLSSWVPGKRANSFDTAQEQFDYCIAKMIESKEKSLKGELENAHTEAHSRNYCNVCNSIKVNFKTVKDVETGKQVPVLDSEGIPTVSSILVPYIEVHTVTVEKGERKVVNSGSKKLMDKCIEAFLGKSYKYKQFSLKDDNFIELVIGKQHIAPENAQRAEQLLAIVS